MKIAIFSNGSRGLTLLCRLTAALLIPTLVITCPAVLEAADQVAKDQADKKIHPDPVVSPTHVTVNHKLPAFTPAGSKFSLPAHPTDQDIFNHPLFEEPLIPIGGKTTAAENAALGQALKTFSVRTERDDFSALEAFLVSYPQSPWRISLLTNLGWSYRQTGVYGKAMDAWQQAWNVGKGLPSTLGKPTIDRALAELIVMNARVGRLDTLKQLIAEADTRQFVGSSKEKLEAAKQAVVLMQKKPDTSFRCGPMAVEQIRNLVDKGDPSKLKTMSMASTGQGTNMAQLKKLASKLGMDYQVAKRTPGASVIVPAVVNWKVGHFACLVEAKGSLWRLRDPTFGNEVWVSTKTLDAEASGYFLVKSGPLPDGWTTVSDKEAATIWGKGNTGGGDPNGNGGPTPKAGCPGTGGGSSSGSPSSSGQAPGGSNSSGRTFGMARYAIYEALCSLSVEDTPLSYAPPYGPKVEFTVTYSQRESNQPSTFTYSNLGPSWTFNWLSYLVDDPTTPGANVNHYLSGGGTLIYSGYNSSTQTYTSQAQTGCVLKVLSPSSYELDEPDGSKQIFAAANNAIPRKVFMTQTIDPQGNGLTFSYDANFRLMGVTDALGQVTTLTYGMSGDPYKVTKVTDPFQRSAFLNYTTGGNLQSTIDTIGLTSSYGYSFAEGTLSTLTTPYGVTSFSTGQNTSTGVRWVQATDPQGGQERVETWSGIGNTSIPASVSPTPTNVDNLTLQYRNSFYWDKKAMLTDAGGLVYTDAVITEWLHEPGYSVMSDQVEGIKKPLESRVYYNYANQPNTIITGTSGQPIRTTRILDDQSTQQTLASYNAMNNLTQSTDALNRVTNYNYDTNGVDLLQVTQQNGANNDVLASATYNSQHEPLTTTDAAGQITHYTYYPDGQIHTITDAKSETTTFAYSNGSSGYLTSITGPQTGATTSIQYDGDGRIYQVTDVNGYTLTYSYDNLNRQTKVTYPDGTYDQNVYTNLDRTQTRDRQGRWTRYVYNPLQQVIAVIDSADRVTNYTRCICGELTAVTDPLLQKTSFTQDIEGRTITKTFADNSQINYQFENTTSRLKTVTDPLNPATSKSQVTTYSYNPDNTVAQIAYTNATVATPTVSFTYDPVYPRLTKMVDGTGTTNYAFNLITTTPTLGAGRLGSETGPLGSTATIAYAYDELGRTTATAINSVSSSVSYDSLGRVYNASNALGSFTYGYYGVTPRLHTLTYPNSQSTSYSYLSTTQDLRLSEIKNLTPASAVLSQNDYTYNEIGTLATWQQQTDSNTPTIWNYGYDRADQLLSAVKTNTSTNAVLSQYFYGYDLGSNRLTEQIGLGVTQSSFNTDNQIKNSSAGGPLRFTGTLNKPGTVTVGGNSAAVDANNNFSGTATVGTGTSTVKVIATNLNGYAATNNYQVVVPSNSTISPTYDVYGNLTNNGNGQTYAWDAKNELTQITYAGGAATSFTYDGRGRRASIIEKNSGGTVTSTKQFVWVGDAMAEERDATGITVTKRFFPQGEQIAGANYFYTRDHLGSIRELTNSSGTIAARYDYDPYGRATLVQGTNLANFQYAGYYEHQTSGLNLTKYRAYDPNTAKWLSRDPAGENGGVNLYGYVHNSSVNLTDSLGLCDDPKKCDSLKQAAQAADAALPALVRALDDSKTQVNATYFALGTAIAFLAWTRYAAIGMIAAGQIPEAIALIAFAYAAVATAGVFYDAAVKAEQHAEQNLNEGQKASSDAWAAWENCVISTAPLTPAPNPQMPLG